MTTTQLQPAEQSRCVALEDGVLGAADVAQRASRFGPVSSQQQRHSVVLQRLPSQYHALLKTDVYTAERSRIAESICAR